MTNLLPKEAIALQRKLAGEVRAEPLPTPVRHVAGIDVSVRGDAFQAAIVVLALPELETVDQAIHRGTVSFPYIPGLLSFRELPAILPALDRLRVAPDVFITDSQGLAHPQRFGLACHLGVLLDRPAFGVAKTLLTGRYEPPAIEKGSRSPLVDHGEEIGAAVRTRRGVQPVFVSIGHRITLDEAVHLTMACTGRFRIPEPTRRAHLLSKSVKNESPSAH